MAEIIKIKTTQMQKFQVVCDAVDNQLTSTKLSIFSFVAKILEPYLVVYQTDNHMVPFFYQDSSVLIRKIMEITGKPKVLSDCNAAITLKRVDLND